jgi:hypothetical protein
MFERAELQGLIEEHRDGFGKQYKPMKSYVDVQEGKIDLRKVFVDYRDRVAQFHAWMSKELESDALVALRDYDALHIRKRHTDSRIFWSGMLGNWLENWKVPPDRHKHLHRFLTPGQLAEVYSLRRNSKEQVDRVIEYGMPNLAASSNNSRDFEGTIDPTPRPHSKGSGLPSA